MSRAVLVIGFNRPDLLLRRVEELADSGARIYVSLDFPKGSEGEANSAYSRCREIAQQPRIHRFNTETEHLGCRLHILKAVDWFFSCEKEGLILEDDVELQTGYESFISAHRNYLEDERFFALCLFNPIKECRKDFSITHWNCWGWYTTAEKWSVLRAAVIRTPKVKFARGTRLMKIGVFLYFTKVIRAVRLNRLDTWDVQVHYTVVEKNFLNIFPSSSLSRHTGYDERATHAGKRDWWENHNYSRNETSTIREISFDPSVNTTYERAWAMNFRSVLVSVFPEEIVTILRKVKMEFAKPSHST